MGQEIEKVEEGDESMELYGEFDPKALEQEQEFVDKVEASDFLKLREGDTIIRAYPNPPGEGLPWILVYEHAIKSGGMNFPFRFPCPRHMARKYCSFCAKSDELMNTGRKPDRDVAFKLKAGQRGYMDVINRSNPEHGPFIFAFGKTVLADLREIYGKPAKGGPFAHPVNGRDLIVTRKGTGQFDTEYSVTASMEKSPFAPDAETMKEWLRMRHDFSKFIIALSDEENMANLESAKERAAEYASGGGRSSGGGGGGGQRGGSRRTASIDDGGDDRNPF